MLFPHLKVKIPTLSQNARQGWGTRITRYLPELRGGDAADQVFLLLLAFGADGEGVEQTQR